MQGVLEQQIKEGVQEIVRLLSNEGKTRKFKDTLDVSEGEMSIKDALKTDNVAKKLRQLNGHNNNNGKRR